MRLLCLCSSVLVVVAGFPSTAVAQPQIREPDSADDAKLLGDFVKEKAKLGWRLKSTPDTFKSCEAVVVVGGNLDSLKDKQDVTLTYSWVVISTVQVDPGMGKKVHFTFRTKETSESEFRIKSPTEPNMILDVSKTRCQELAGTDVKITVEASKQETKLVVGLQQVLQVYSTGEQPRLLATGYLRKYGTALLVLKNDK